jgi:hypothetical protein
MRCGVRGARYRARGTRYKARSMRYGVRGTKYICLVFKIKLIQRVGQCGKGC